MPWGGLLGTGVSLLASWLASRSASDASNNASQAQADAINKALELQAQQWDRSYRTQLPWVYTGGKAVGALGALMGLTGGNGMPDANQYFWDSTHPGGGGRFTPGGPGTPLPRVQDTPDPNAPPPDPNATPPPGNRQPPDPPGGRVGARMTSLTTVGTGASAPQGGGGYSVTDPNGGVHTFGSQIEAYSFAKQAGVA